MVVFGYVLLIFYCLSLLCILGYSVLQLDLLFYYKRPILEEEKPVLYTSEKFEPFVSIQLPIFNEQYVVERLIDNMVRIDYPKHKFEIQILDDSTDVTSEIAQDKVLEYQQQGFHITYLHRPNREGYKAGALRDGLPFCKGEFIVIFDADFLPNKDFLQLTLPYFDKDPQIGVVQTRWEHLNQDYSLLTKLQALQLNVHFTIEQVGRMKGGLLLQFNGTAGVWRKSCIIDAGGWQTDTLTEDFDLSFRAQLKGWKFKFLEDVGSPAELPAEMNGVKSQQFRWMKGGAENARKLMGALWDSPLLLRQKLHATQQLLASGMFAAVFIMGFVSVPLVEFIPVVKFDTDFFFISLCSLLIILALSLTANTLTNVRKPDEASNTWGLIGQFLLFLPLASGLSFHNSIAVWEGYTGKKSSFVRTPKYGVRSNKDSLKGRRYLSAYPTPSTIFEGFLAIYFAYGVWMGIHSSVHVFIIFHIMLALGFGTIFFYTIKHLRA